MVHSNIDMKQPINYKSLGSSKFSSTNLVFFQLECIFTSNPLYLAITHFNGFNMDIHKVFTFLKNLRPLVSKIPTRFINSKNLCMNMYECHHHFMIENKMKRRRPHIYFGVDFEIFGFYTHHCQNSQFCLKIAENSHYFLAIDLCEYANIKFCY